MPLTPLHYWPAYLIKKFRPNLNMFSLVFGSYAPDLEVLYFRLTNANIDRLVLHSLLGSVTLVPLISLAVVYITFKLLKRKINPKNILISSAFGGLTHVLLDTTTHLKNPLLFPFGPYINFLIVPNVYQSSMIINFFCATAILFIFIYEYSKEKNIYKTLHYMLFGD